MGHLISNLEAEPMHLNWDLGGQDFVRSLETG